MPGAGAGPGHRLRLRVPAEACGLFEAALAGLGAAVVSGGPEADGRIPLDAYFAAAPPHDKLTAHLAAAAAAAGIAVPEAAVEALPEVDWVAESYRGLPAVRAGRVTVYGAHNPPPPAGSIGLRIEAGAAFGTGRHESTRGCLLALQGLAKRGLRVRRGLDMGCGSGLLALAMARLWRCRVVAADSDLRAVAICLANARANGCARRVTAVLSEGYAAPAVRGGAPYDLVCANILAGPLATMAGDLARRLAPGGRVVLAGLLARQQHAVFARHRAMGLVLERRLILGEWATLVLRRPGRR